LGLAGSKPYVQRGFNFYNVRYVYEAEFIFGYLTPLGKKDVTFFASRNLWWVVGMAAFFI
jgi:hypothetical protein